MKKLTGFLVMVVLFACSSEAYKTEEMPDVVKNAFKSAYANATDAEWEQEGDYFVVEFEEDGVEKEVVYDKQGNVISWEIELSEEDLLPAIISYIDENYPDHEFEEAEKEETEEGIFFEVTLEDEDENEIELIFDKNGGFVGLDEEEDDEGGEGHHDGDEDDDAEENEVEIEISALPQVVKDNIAAAYAGAELLEADEVTQDDGSITYDVEIKVNGEVVEVIYKADGTFIGLEQDDEDEDEEDDEDED